MSLLYVVIVLYAQNSFAFDLPRKECNSKITIKDDHYNLTHTYDVGDASPIDTHYDIYGNLFYVKSGKKLDEYYLDVYIVKQGTKQAQRINGLPERVGYSIAIDKTEAKVYFGTGKGIYRYNYRTNAAELFMHSDPNLNSMFIDKDGNKYVTESVNGVEELYLLDGNKKIPFHTLESLQEVAVDDHNNFYYIKEERLMVLRSTSTTPNFIGNVTYDRFAQISFYNNFVFVASQTLQYYHDNDTQGLKDIKNSPRNVTAVAFDNSGNLAVGVKGKILNYEKSDCSFKNLQNPNED